MFITANSSADEENIDDLGKVSKKKSRKKSGDSPNSIFEEKNYFFFMMMMTNLHCNPKAFFTSEFILWRALSIQTDPFHLFQGPHRTILGHPKHVLHLVLSPNAIAKAFNVM